MADLKAGTTIGGAGLWNASNLQLQPSGNTIAYRGFKIYTENDKPAPIDIGALANTGSVNFDGVMTMTGTSPLRLTSPQAQIELGSVTGPATPAIDFHTTGVNRDYDIRMMASGSALSISAFSGGMFLDLGNTNRVQFNSSGTTEMRGYGGNTFFRDYANGNITLSALRTGAGAAGVLYIGYNNTSTDQYTGTVRLESPMTWRGSNQLVNTSGQLVSSSLDIQVYNKGEGDARYVLKTGDTMTGPLTVTKVQTGIDGIMIGDNDSGIIGPSDGVIRVISNGAGFVDFDGRNTAKAGTIRINGSMWAANNGHGYGNQFGVPAPLNVDFSQTGEGYLPALKATSIVSGRGYATQASIGLLREGGNAWGKLALFVASEEGTGAGHPAAAATLDSGGVFTATTLFAGNNIFSTGETNANVLTTRSNLYLRASGRRHVVFGSDSGEDGYLFKDPAGVNNGQLVLQSGGHSLRVREDGWVLSTATIRSDGQIHAGGGSAVMAADGNISGSRFGGWLGDWGDAIRNIANDALNRATDAQNNRGTDIRRGGQQFVSPPRNFGNWELSDGYLTGVVNSTDDGNIRYSSFYFRVPAIYIPSRGWVNAQNL